MKNALEAIKEFHNKYPNMPKPPSSTTRIREVALGLPRPPRDLA